ncbi:tripartite tricarboxylate transporter substrate binding protein [Siccirubricoccus sp. KC 17139]|uniref:Tripartite tricarboxylate transporter substrate binding protein n=1 Tax=Siccirubricoccus soli TaxID=2899147 RepID=A0ABT1DB46_9PROT|nr:tripartite tricarboxylate transporter substrate binding protein [Siccirubricoccus soli]MCO6419148.1 tripartite tricarboxylate transporter substrate binding protein [Siccirubricoccus soli]MCP2685283.1 tripartite tricarboxylate transporter substrate binding protein [Siccirubricoccus soli]
MPSRRALLALPFPATAASAEEAWPSRSIRVIIPFAPGGSSDIAARIVAPRLSALLGQSLLIENRGGAGGNVAAEMAARAAPDGYTLFQGNIGILAVNPTLYRSLTWNPVADFVPISHLLSVFYVLVTPIDRPWGDLKALIAAAKAAPETLSAGNSGVGSMGHLAQALFDRMAGVRTVPVPYRGGGPLANDVLAGKLDFSFSTAPTVLPMIESRRVKALAVATATRTTLLPQVPTMAEAGLPGFEVPNWDSWLAPRGTPPAVLAKLQAALRQVLTQPEVVAEFARRGMETFPSSPEQLGAEIPQRIAQFAPIVRATGATPD